MNNHASSELDQLFYEVNNYHKTSEYFELLDFIAKFKHIAPFNAFLLHAQRPGSRFVATASEWLKKYERTIKSGARPLIILIPFGPVQFVYEVSDTEGKELPQQVSNPFSVKGEVNDAIYHQFVENLPVEGIKYIETIDGSQLAGSIRLANPKYKAFLERGKFVYKLRVYFEMHVNSYHDNTTKFTTILHELGHLFCGHLTFKDATWIPRRGKLDIHQREFEAESVCWLVCSRMGLKPPSAEYLHGYRNKDGSIPEIDLISIIKAVGRIEKLLGTNPKIHNKLIIEKEKIATQLSFDFF
jgi:hypothetical protein